jgi:hypothetical protein
MIARAYETQHNSEMALVGDGQGRMNILCFACTYLLTAPSTSRGFPAVLLVGVVTGLCN